MSQTNRIAGACFVAFGLLLWFVIIPAQTEAADGGHMPPDFMPRICAALMAGGGFWQLVRPRGEIGFDARQGLAVATWLAIVAVGVAAMSQFGFVAVAPVLAAVLMLRTGERRWTWLTIGVLLIPVGVWFGVVKLLGRTIT